MKYFKTAMITEKFRIIFFLSLIPQHYSLTLFISA